MFIFTFPCKLLVHLKLFPHFQIGGNNSLVVVEVEINNLPPPCRNTLTRGTTQEEVFHFIEKNDCVDIIYECVDTMTKANNVFPFFIHSPFYYLLFSLLFLISPIVNVFFLIYFTCFLCLICSPCLHSLPSPSLSSIVPALVCQPTPPLLFLSNMSIFFYNLNVWPTH